MISIAELATGGGEVELISVLISRLGGKYPVGKC